MEKSRVKDAYAEKEAILKKNFQVRGLNFEGFHIFIRAFKHEKELEVWILPTGATQLVHLKTYDFCSSSGTLGPKRKEGDLQIPEGVYHINHFNPESNFHLSLGINYPNAADKIFSDPKHPGSAIYIHGNCVTVGCIPISDDKIKELYVLAVEAKNNGQEQIPVHIFPARFTNESLRIFDNHTHPHHAFWKNLQVVYEHFEKTKKLPKISVGTDGSYVLK